MRKTGFRNFPGSQPRWHQLTLAHLFFLLILSCQKDLPLNARTGCDFLEDISSFTGLDCGRLEVPENHDDTTGKKIEIAYVVIKALDPETGSFPLIRFTGGPGAAAITENSIRGWLRHPVRKKRDIILFDQRGIGYSSALPNMESELFDLMGQDADEAAEGQLMADLVEKYRLKCQEQHIRLENYNSFQNARDVGLIMKHLGYQRYNLYGTSYGTRLARIVQDKYPEQVHTVILNSPAPLGGNFLLDRLESYALALNRIFDWCRGDPACHSAYPQLKEEYLAAINSLNERPIRVLINEKPFYINGQDGIYFLRRLLYGNDSRRQIPQLIRAYQAGGGNLIGDLIQTELLFSSHYNSTMWLAVERYEMFDPAIDGLSLERIYKDLSLFPARLGMFTSFYLAAGDWHPGLVPEADKAFRRSEIPTLITVNHYDPVTPPEYAHRFMEKLDRGQLFILDEGGHGGGNSECRIQLMIDFMDNPAGPLDSSCLNIYNE